jgi:hypothetical protein
MKRDDPGEASNDPVRPALARGDETVVVWFELEASNDPVRLALARGDETVVVWFELDRLWPGLPMLPRRAGLPMLPRRVSVGESRPDQSIPLRIERRSSSIMAYVGGLVA